MPAFTSLGVGSNLDINTIVTQLVALERKPLEVMKGEASRLQTQVSAYGKLQSLFSGLQDASSALSNVSLWQRSVASSADDSVVAAGSSNGAAAGNYAITVENLAKSQAVVSAAPFGASTDLVGAGTMRLELGTWAGIPLGFSGKVGAAAIDVTITATDTLATLRDKINSANAGVTASIVTDASGSRLALRSTTTGAESGFRVTTTDADGNDTDAAGLSRLAYDPPSGTSGMQIKQAAENAKATVNGIPVESASNELGSVVDGLTIKLRQLSATPVEITVTADRDAVEKAVNAFASAYNDLAKFIADQTKYDAASKIGGPLQGDSAINNVQGRMRAVLNMTSGASTNFPRLSDIGLQLQRDGTLKVDATKLGKALDNLPELRKAFSNSDPQAPASDGFGRRFTALASQLLGVDGSITTHTEGLRRLITKNSDNQSRLNDRVDRFQARLVAQYTAMDTNMARLNALSSYVSQQIAAMSNSGSK